MPVPQFEIVRFPVTLQLLTSKPKPRPAVEISKLPRYRGGPGREVPGDSTDDGVDPLHSSCVELRRRTVSSRMRALYFSVKNQRHFHHPECRTAALLTPK
jgi:hypothetical protein